MENPLRKLFRFGLIFALLGVLNLGHAQGTIEGVVIDANNDDPLPGVSVFIPELEVGTATDVDGRYEISGLSAGEHTVEARFIGYRTGTRTVTVQDGETVTLNFELRPSALDLEEVVVTGTGGPVERRRLGNTISTIDMAGLEDAPISNFSELIQGREPGVSGLPSGGMTGTGSRIRIRGSASISQANEPIVYVDGVRVDREGGLGGFVWDGGGSSPSRLDDLNPEAIQRVEILKGAAAATLYGTEASNGVIQIFTRQGQVGPPRFTFQIEQSASAYPRDAIAPNTGFARSQAVADTMSTHFEQTIRPYQLHGERFIEDIYGTGHTQTYSASMSGGTEGITYYVNGRWSGEDGPLDFSGVEYPPGFQPRAADLNRLAQFSANINVVPTDRLQLRLVTGLTDRGFESVSSNNYIYGTVSLSQFSKPELVAHNNLTGSPAFATVRESLQARYTQDITKFYASLATVLRVSDELDLSGTFGFDHTNQVSTEFRPFRWNLDNFSGLTPEGGRYYTDRNHTELTMDIQASYNTEFNDTWDGTTLIGVQGFLTHQVQSTGLGEDFPGPGFEVMGAAATRDVAESFLEVINLGVFGQQQIGFNNYLFGTVGARLDANSAFGSDFDAILYPKASLSFIPSDAPFWGQSGQGVLSQLRFRTAIGYAGLQPGAFDALTTYGSLSSGTGPGIVPDNLGNPGLRPEISREIEFGAELGLFDDRYAVEATYWNRVVTDALVPRQFPVTGGFISTQLDNIGSIKGQGFELGIDAQVFERRNFRAELFGSASYLWEEVADLGEAPPLKVGGSYPRYRNFIREGYAPGAHFGAKLLDVPEGHLPFDVTGDGEPDSRDEILAWLAGLTPETAALPTSTGMVLLDLEGVDPNDPLTHYLGKPQPDWRGSFGGSATLFRNLTISTMFEFAFGNYYVNDLTSAFRQANAVIGRNLPESARVERDFITGGVDDNYNPQNDPEVRLAALEEWLYGHLALAPFSGLNAIKPADFLRWREVSVTYRVPQRLLDPINVRSLSLTLAGRNLAIWTRYDGIDPELNAWARGAAGLSGIDQNFLDGVDAFGLPLPRRIAFTLRMGI